MELSGKRVLITGGSSGIGLALAQAQPCRRCTPAAITLAVDARILALKPALEQSVQDHGAL